MWHVDLLVSFSCRKCLMIITEGRSCILNRFPDCYAKSRLWVLLVSRPLNGTDFSLLDCCLRHRIYCASFLLVCTLGWPWSLDCGLMHSWTSHICSARVPLLPLKHKKRAGLDHNRRVDEAVWMPIPTAWDYLKYALWRRLFNSGSTKCRLTLSTGLVL